MNKSDPIKIIKIQLLELEFLISSTRSLTYTMNWIRTKKMKLTSLTDSTFSMLSQQIMQYHLNTIFNKSLFSKQQFQFVSLLSLHILLHSLRILWDRLLLYSDGNSERTKESSWENCYEWNRDNLAGLFAEDALPEVIGLGITLITTLLINGWSLYWFHWSARPVSHHPKQWWM